MQDFKTHYGEADVTVGQSGRVRGRLEGRVHLFRPRAECEQPGSFSAGPRQSVGPRALPDAFELSGRRLIVRIGRADRLDVSSSLLDAIRPRSMRFKSRRPETLPEAGRCIATAEREVGMRIDSLVLQRTARLRSRYNAEELELIRAGELHDVSQVELAEALHLLARIRTRPSPAAVRGLIFSLRDGVNVARLMELKNWDKPAWGKYSPSFAKQVRKDFLNATDNFTRPDGLSTLVYRFRHPSPIPVSEIVHFIHKLLRDQMTEMGMPRNQQKRMLEVFDDHAGLVQAPKWQRTGECPCRTSSWPLSYPCCARGSRPGPSAWTSRSHPSPMIRNDLEQARVGAPSCSRSMWNTWVSDDGREGFMTGLRTGARVRDGR